MKRKYKSSRTFDDTNPKGGKREIVKLEQFVELFSLPKNNKYVQLRLVGPVIAIATHWIDLKTKEGKKVTIPKACSRYVASEDTFDTTKDCVYCEHLSEYPARQRYLVNAIVRDIQEDQPSKFQKKYSDSEKKSGFKDGTDSKAWTPIRVLSLPAGVAKKLKGLAELNRHKINGKTKAMPISDDEYGMDIMLKYDPDAQAAQAYDIQKGDASPLTDEELEYLHWNIEEAVDNVNNNMKEDAKTQKTELKQLMKSVISKDKKAGKKDYEDSDDDAPKKKKGKSKSKKEDSDEISEEESSDLEMSEDSDDAPKKKKGKSKSKKEDSDEESDEESSDLEMSEDSEESEEAPKKKGKGKAKSKKEDSDEDSDEESDEESSDLELSEDSDEDSEEESDAPKKKGKSKSKSKKEDSDEESEESSDLELSEDSEEESEESEESEAPKKKSKKKRK